jgi:hypothetical protein
VASWIIVVEEKDKNALSGGLLEAKVPENTRQ